MIDRLSLRVRPPGRPVMRQTWGKLLFLHWPLEPERLRHLIPSRLEIDTFAGRAWISLTPFTMWGIRPPFFPALPLVSRSHEINVRTYVHLDEVPGVWFLSLDADNPLVVLSARTVFHLPYCRARMSLREKDGAVHFSSRRTSGGCPPAHFEAEWRLGGPLPEARPGTIDFFLIERYCLYAAREKRLFRARIHHRPWPLRQAWLENFASTMIQSHGLRAPNHPPLLHAQAAPLEVGIWPLHAV